MRIVELIQAKRLPVWVVLAWPTLLVILLFATSGRFLVVNQPQKADLIVVLAGETDARPERGLELLRKHYAPEMMINVPAEVGIYGENMLHLARNYVDKLPERQSILLCPIFGLSTKTETRDVVNCIRSQSVHSLLVVSSDFHTRRARMIFRREFPAYQIFVAAAFDAREFGPAWWKHRQWAKNNLGEWVRLLWWELIERWSR